MENAILANHNDGNEEANLKNQTISTVPVGLVREKMNDVKKKQDAIQKALKALLEILGELSTNKIVQVQW